jgi:FtsZ-interacting cell division protein YlmF
MDALRKERADMSFLDDLKRWAKGEDDDIDEDELEAVSPQRKQPAQKSSDDEVSIPVTDFRRASKDKVVNINATTQLSVVLVKPEKFENAAEIADHLREKRTVVLNLEQTNKDVAAGWWIFSAASSTRRTARSRRSPTAPSSSRRTRSTSSAT